MDVSWILNHVVPSLLLIVVLIVAVYVARDQINDRMSRAWREVAEASEKRIKQLEEEVAALSAQVELLSSRPDLTAAIQALADHEVKAQDRHAALLQQLTTLVSAIKERA
jgi:cell division protein FtsB